MTEWFQAGYFAGDLLIRRADVQEDNEWLELLAYMKRLNQLVGRNVGVTFNGPPLKKVVTSPAQFAGASFAHDQPRSHNKSGEHASNGSHKQPV